MRVTFERVDNKTPFRIGATTAMGPDEDPCFALNPMKGINPASKAYAKGFVFMERGVSVEFICRFMAFVMKRWPDTTKTFKEFIDEVTRSEVFGDLPAGTNNSALHTSAPGDPPVSV